LKQRRKMYKKIHSGRFAYLPLAFTGNFKPKKAMQIDWSIVVTVLLSVGSSFIALQNKLTQNRDKVQEVSTLLAKLTVKVEQLQEESKTSSNQIEELKTTITYLKERLEKIENKLEK